MSAQPQPFVTPEQYLVAERASEFRHDYYDGQLYAMSGGSYVHAQTICNLSRELGVALKKRKCTVTTSDVRLRASPGKLYTYPDLIVVCGDPEFADEQKDTLLNPSLVVEILSPSTEAYDRGIKAAHYRALESLQEYALISQFEARVELFRRQPENRWLLIESVGLESDCHFASVDCRIALSEIYDKIVFAPAMPPLP